MPRFNLWAEFMQARYPSSLQHNSRFETHKVVPSTNLLALERARQGEMGPLWIVAEEQTQGVGRRGRTWHSPPGNLYASLLLVADYPADKTALLGFVAGVAMAETLTGLVGNMAKIQLKWPNDVLLNGAKLTGILVERHPLLKEKAAIIIGIGINVAHAPSQANYAVTSLASSGFYIKAAPLFNRLAHFWERAFILWDEGQGFEKIRQKWLGFAAGLGHQIHILKQGEIISGIFKTIDVTGQLVIEKDEGEQVIVSAGDVYFGNVATFRPIESESQNAG